MAWLRCLAAGTSKLSAAPALSKRLPDLRSVDDEAAPLVAGACSSRREPARGPGPGAWNIALAGAASPRTLPADLAGNAALNIGSFDQLWL